MDAAAAAASTAITQHNYGMPSNGMNPLTVMQQDGDTASLPTAIQEWRRVQDEIEACKQQIREKTRRSKALEQFIMAIMKRYNIGALDLKTSNGRVLYKRSKRQEGLGPKTLGKLLTEYTKSEDKATEILQFINENRETKVSEKLSYEKFD
jgi:hypothetical protein